MPVTTSVSLFMSQRQPLTSMLECQGSHSRVEEEIPLCSRRYRAMLADPNVFPSLTVVQVCLLNMVVLSANVIRFKCPFSRSFFCCQPPNFSRRCFRSSSVYRGHSRITGLAFRPVRVAATLFVKWLSLKPTLKLL